ncbi:MAG TPA: hypothetical protein VHC69_16980 [Polyangiaceae bacterium]|nr:hypothetical protein [Polyangiaceae bacterium]
MKQTPALADSAKAEKIAHKVSCHARALYGQSMGWARGTMKKNALVP